MELPNGIDAMPPIDPNLLGKLKKALGVGRSQIYDLIQRKVAQTHLDRHLAAIVVASEAGISISKYTTSDELATIRGAGRNQGNPAPSYSAAKPIRTIRVLEPLEIDLSFIHSSSLRSILKRDLSELNAARSSGIEKTAKTCMVLAGSIIEALLLDAIKHKLKRAKVAASTLSRAIASNPEEWGLADLVEVAVAMSPPLLPKDAEAGASQLRQWRNLIHPGRELRENRRYRIKPTKARAGAAVALLRFVAEELG